MIRLSGVPSSQEVRGLEVGDRPITVKSISSASYFHDGHTSTSEEGAKTRYVGDVDRLVRRLPSHPDEGGITSVPLFPSRSKEIYVPSTSFRSNVGSMVVYSGSQTSQEVGSQKQPGTIPVLGTIGSTYRPRNKN